MIHWIDIAAIVFICVTMNHLGLVKAIEDTIGRRIIIMNCVKCASFWCVLVYMMTVTSNVIPSLAISFLASYTAIWLELFEGFIDSLYMKIYEKIYPNPTDDTLTAADFDDDDSAGTVSEL